MNYKTKKKVVNCNVAICIANQNDIFKNVEKHILTSSPSKFRWERPCSHEMGVKGNFATTLPSKIELNMDSKEVKAKPIANILFIFTCKSEIKNGSKYFIRSVY